MVVRKKFHYHTGLVHIRLRLDGYETVNRLSTWIPTCAVTFAMRLIDSVPGSNV